MRRHLFAASAAVLGLALASQAHATIFLGDAEGTFTASAPRSWDGPAILAGDAFTVNFTFDDSLCDMVGEMCYGGMGDPGPLHALPVVATLTVDNWTRTITGRDLQVISPHGIHLEDFDLTLIVSQTGGGHMTVETGGTPFQLGMSVSNYDPEPIGGVPEPATWALMLAGTLGLGAALRVRRAQIA